MRERLRDSEFRWCILEDEEFDRLQTSSEGGA